MRKRVFSLIFAFSCLLLGNFAVAEDEEKKLYGPEAFVDTRTARYEIEYLPRFRTETQEYRLLIFGVEKEKPTMWMIVDGEDIYLDLNGNGDLTEKNEMKTLEDKKVQFKTDKVKVNVSRWMIGKRMNCLILTEYQSIIQSKVYSPSTSTTKNAPIFHMSGPLQIVLGINRFKGDKGVYLSTTVVTSYKGVESVNVRYSNIDKAIKPKLQFQFADGPSRDYFLERRC